MPGTFYGLQMERIQVLKLRVISDVMVGKIQKMHQFLGLNVSGQLDASPLAVM